MQNAPVRIPRRGQAHLGHGRDSVLREEGRQRFLSEKSPRIAGARAQTTASSVRLPPVAFEGDPSAGAAAPVASTRFQPQTAAGADQTVSETLFSGESTLLKFIEFSFFALPAGGTERQSSASGGDDVQ